MQKTKMSLANIQGKLSRVEMKNIMAGSGSGTNCAASCTGSCTASGHSGKCATNSGSGRCNCVAVF